MNNEILNILGNVKDMRELADILKDFRIRKAKICNGKMDSYSFGKFLQAYEYDVIADISFITKNDELFGLEINSRHVFNPGEGHYSAQRGSRTIIAISTENKECKELSGIADKIGEVLGIKRDFPHENFILKHFINELGLSFPEDRRHNLVIEN